MRFHYIAPSILPSRSANAVHVVMQCEAIANLGARVTIFAKRAVPDQTRVLVAIREAYGVGLPEGRVVSFYSKATRADNWRIAALAVRELNRGCWPDAILSRNLYAAFATSVLQRKPLLFETHQLEHGARKWMQRAIITRPWVTTIVISDKLLECLGEHHGADPRRALVLRDAAPEGITPLASSERSAVLTALLPEATGQWDAVCGYFGQLFGGRGVEVIEAMAEARPRVLFLMFGGNETDIAARRASNRRANLRFLGHVVHPVAREAMRAVDVLLMPYQESVSIGVPGHDTARWMSPMKMFEYMASGVPIISSDLPALREVLKDGVNSLLVGPGDHVGWIAALDRLLADSGLAKRLGERAHQEYRSEYTWGRRAQRILEAASSV